MEPSKDVFKEAILGPIEDLELGVPMPLLQAKTVLAGRNPKLLPKQWLSDPLRRRIDAQLDVPSSMVALRDPPIYTPSVWVKAKSQLLAWLLVLSGASLLAWGAWRSGWLQ